MWTGVHTIDLQVLVLLVLKTHADELAEGGGDEAPALSLFGALAMLTCITLVVATNSE